MGGVGLRRASRLNRWGSWHLDGLVKAPGALMLRTRQSESWVISSTCGPTRVPPACGGVTAKPAGSFGRFVYWRQGETWGLKSENIPLGLGFQIHACSCGDGAVRECGGVNGVTEQAGWVLALPGVLGHDVLDRD
jgi:hypothetical protein